MQKPQIWVPQLCEEDLVTCYAQLRPYREGGIRIQKQIVYDKNIIHNYGHGGAGVSLAPATAYQAVNLAQNILHKDSNVGIIGSGIVGLMTAHEILRRSPTIKLTIYADQVPNFGNKNNKDMITSQVAPGFWLPYGYGSLSQESHNKYSRFSFEWYKKMSALQQYKQCIKEVVIYDLSDGQGSDDVISQLTEDLKPTLKQFQVTLNGKAKVQCSIYKTYKIDMQLFLKIFMSELKNKVNFVKLKITSQTIKTLSQTTIFNCSGLGSRELFGDTKLRGVKGHLLEYKNIKPEKYDYFLRVNVGKKQMFYYMHSSRIIMGKTVEHQQNREVNLKVVKQLQAVHKLILQKFNLTSTKPKL